MTDTINMAKINLDPGEYITEPEVKQYSPSITFLFKTVLPVLFLTGIAMVIYYVFPSIIRIGNKPVLKDIAVYKIARPIYLAFAVFLLLALMYYLVSLFTEKIILTNKAILRRNVFSVDRIYYKDINGIEQRRGSFNTIVPSKTQAFFMRTLLGINHILIIKSPGKELVINEMNEHFAGALSNKLEQLRVPLAAGYNPLNR